MNLVLIATLFISFFLTYRSIPVIVRISNLKNLFDVPNGRKLNRVGVPTMGGVGIFAGFSISAILFMQKAAAPELQFLAVAILMMFFVGLKDDLVILAAKKKLVIQILAAMVLVLAGGFRITHVYGMFSTGVFSDWFSIPLSVLIILFLINAINLIDGIDGLAAGLTLLVSLALGTWFFLTGYMNYTILCLALAGSLTAFLRFNLFGRENKIFMGDTGSLILGVFLAAMIIRFNELNFFADSRFQFSHAPLVALALLIVPVTDTLRVFAIRIKHKRSPFSPDMNHFHHLLIKLKFTHIQATGFMLAYTAAFVILALIMDVYRVELTFAFFFLLTLSFICVGMIYAWYKYLTAVNIVKQRMSSLKVVRNITDNKPAGSKTPKIALPEPEVVALPEKHLGIN